MSDQHIGRRRTDLYSAISVIKVVDLVDEEREHCDGSAGDKATDSPQAPPEEQEDDTEYERCNEAQRPGGIHIPLTTRR
ncbi:MAG TPA: hypothetical protein VGJ39_03190 [Vicinamibacterales bacterium]